MLSSLHTADSNMGLIGGFGFESVIWGSCPNLWEAIQLA